MTHLVRQRYSDDCTVAACAMGTDIPYLDVLAVAQENGFVPDEDRGIPIDHLLGWLDFSCQITPGFYCPDPSRAVLMCIQAPNSEDYHAVMLYQGVVYDPVGRVLGVNVRYCILNAIYSYWDISYQPARTLKA